MTDEDIKALADTELCVCHIQSDCPTHPKGDFGAMTDTEINKVCAKLMGKCWHDWVKQIMPSQALHWVCDKRECGYVGGYAEHHDPEPKPGPDPLNSKSDWADLVFFCVEEWEGWEKFCFLFLHGFSKLAKDSVMGLDWRFNKWKKRVKTIPAGLFKDQRALPMVLALYEKEKEG